MVNRRCVVEAFLVFSMLADFGLAIRSLHSQVRIVNGECHFRGSDLKQGYLTLKDGRCFEAACVPGEGRAVFRLTEFINKEDLKRSGQLLSTEEREYKLKIERVRQCGRSDYGRYCWVSDGYLSTRCCHQAVLCQ